MIFTGTGYFGQKMEQKTKNMGLAPEK